jgi:hypothetical protein
MIRREGSHSIGPQGEPRSPWEGFSSALTAVCAGLLVLVMATALLALSARPGSYEQVSGPGPATPPSPSPSENTEEALGSDAAPAGPRTPASSTALRVEPATLPASSSSGNQGADRTALIIGINQAGDGAPLFGSITDARNVETALGLYGFAPKDVSMLLEGEATREAILHELDKLADRTAPDGIAVFAVATHTRIRGGVNEILTADGLQVSAHELAERLGRVQANTLVLLPTCYAAGYDLAGITGPRRLAIFASRARERGYQQGEAGSYLVQYVVREAMVKGHAPDTVQESFRYAEERLRIEYPNRVPIMSDGIGKDLVLGRWAGDRPPRIQAADSDTPEPSPSPGWRNRPPSRDGMRICNGPVRFRCRTEG